MTHQWSGCNDHPESNLLQPSLTWILVAFLCGCWYHHGPYTLNQWLNRMSWLCQEETLWQHTVTVRWQCAKILTVMVDAQNLIQSNAYSQIKSFDRHLYKVHLHRQWYAIPSVALRCETSSGSVSKIVNLDVTICTWNMSPSPHLNLSVSLSRSTSLFSEPEVAVPKAANAEIRQTYL